jgi:hypothetical protein
MHVDSAQRVNPFNSRQWRWYRQCVAKTQSISDLAGQFHRWLGGWIERNPEGAARIALWIEEQTERSDEAAPIDLLKSFMDGLVPRNWWPLRLGMHLQAQSTMAESGICLVWVPPTGTVEAIVCAPSKEERDRVLLANTETILEALDQALGEATHPELTTTVEAAREAVDTYRDGRMRGAQTLAAATLGEVVEGHFGFEKFSIARRAFESEQTSDAGLWSYRRVAIQTAIRAAILRSEEQGSAAGFNRHLSVHGVSGDQFTPAHALAGLMLVVGALRELHEIYRVAERGFGPSPRLGQHAQDALQRRIPAVDREIGELSVVSDNLRAV